MEIQRIRWSFSSYLGVGGRRGGRGSLGGSWVAETVAAFAFVALAIVVTVAVVSVSATAAKAISSPSPFSANAQLSFNLLSAYTQTGFSRP
ncbi:hypothetical protein [Paenibacillus allorhizoplanae]|uniref:hypothetical protein n=1 Tax=Paenibacillus allorhizoplanae TaxID=2905648 RepID=UPI001F3C0571|nr:hypothetical protein [Paenibacillus allorhizoplanae]